MPQMAPLNWLFLFLFYCLMFFIFNTLNYYCVSYKMNNNIDSSLKSLNTPFKNNFNWKW